MKKNIVLYAYFVIATLLIAFLYYPISEALNSYAATKIEEEANKSREVIIEKRDSILKVKGGLTGRFSCVLYHHSIPQYEKITPKEREFLRSYITKGMDYDNNLYIFRPFFPTDEKTSLNWLCHEITEWNISKGHERFVPLKNINLKGWYQSGWALGSVSGGNDSYYCSIIHPYILDFGEHEINMENINELLDDSYSFFTKNENSDFYHCDDTTYFKCYTMLNTPNSKGKNYWYWETEGAYDKTITDKFSARGIYGQFWRYKDYKVFLGVSNVTRYSLKYDEDFADNKKKEMASFYKLILLIAICIMETFAILFMRNIIRAKKKKSIPLLKRIITCSHPKRYIKRGKYDKEKLEIANTIYEKAINANEDDEEVIASLCKELEDKLGIYIITHREIEELKKTCNPKHFMNPYDAQKVKIANELYAKLDTDVLSYYDYYLYMKQASELNQ